MDPGIPHRLAELKALDEAPLLARGVVTSAMIRRLEELGETEAIGMLQEEERQMYDRMVLEKRMTGELRSRLLRLFS